MRFSDEFLSEIRERNDIIDVISPYVDLHTRGSTATGLCPFHNEKTPSFTVYINTQSYYCFGCGAGGDAITFIKNIENLDYAEAVKTLADRTGIPLPTDGYDDGVAKMRRRMLEANREAAKFFHSRLFTKEGKTGLDYFLGRGLTVETIRHFGLGFAPDSWDSLIKHLKKAGFTENELISADLAKRTQRGSIIDTYRNRAMFPIIDVRGSVIAFGGRVLDDSKPKYVNTSDTLVYKKSRGVFALNFAKRGIGKELILCEGYMDVIAYHQAGFTNAVAGLGTAFTNEQAKLISKYCDEVILSYDSDEAGQKATAKAIEILSKTPLRIKVVRLDGGKDPDEIIKKYGKDKMRQLLDSAVSDVEYELIKSKKNYNLQNDDDKIEYLNKTVDFLSKSNNPIQWDVYASKLASELGVAKEAIVAQIKKKSKQHTKTQTKERFSRAATFNDDAIKKVNPERQRNLRASKAEERLLASLIKNCDFYPKIRDMLSSDDFSSAVNARIYGIIAQRLNENRPVEPTYLSQDLTDDEMSYLVHLESMHGNLGNTVDECIDCIKCMAEEKKERMQKNPASMSDEEWAKLFSS